mgnify:FL=1
MARAKWLELFFKKFRGTKATVLGKDCCEIVKFLALNPQSFASMSELLEEAEDEEDEDWDESYKIAVSTEVDTVLANLAAELTRNGGSPATVSFDIAVLNEIRQQMNTCSEDDSKDEDDKKRWGEAERCKELLDVRLKEKENEMMQTSKKAVMKERLLQLAEKKRVAEQAAAGASPIKVKRDGDIVVSPRRFITVSGGDMIYYDADELCRKKMDKKGLRLKIYKVPKKVISGMSSSNGKDFHRCSIFGVSKQKTFVEIISWSKLHCEQVVRIFATSEGKVLDIATVSIPKGTRKNANLQLELDQGFKVNERPDLATEWNNIDVEYVNMFQNIPASRKERQHVEGFIQSEDNTVSIGKNGGAYMYCRMSDIYGKVVEVTVLGEATSAIEWEAGQFVAVFNATVDFEKKKLIVGNDALVCDRSEGFMVSFPESFDDVQW